MSDDEQARWKNTKWDKVLECVVCFFGRMQIVMKVRRMFLWSYVNCNEGKYM